MNEELWKDKTSFWNDFDTSKTSKNLYVVALCISNSALSVSSRQRKPIHHLEKITKISSGRDKLYLSLFMFKIYSCESQAYLLSYYIMPLHSYVVERIF